jgi:hypothetical protein
LTLHWRCADEPGALRGFFSLTSVLEQHHHRHHGGYSQWWCFIISHTTRLLLAGLSASRQPRVCPHRVVVCGVLYSTFARHAVDRRKDYMRSTAHRQGAPGAFFAARGKGGTSRVPNAIGQDGQGTWRAATKGYNKMGLWARL